MVNLLKVLKRRHIGKDSAKSIAMLPTGLGTLGAAAKEFTAGATAWVEATPVTIGTVDSTYPCGIAAIALSNFSVVDANWEAVVVIRSVSATGTVLAEVPFAGNVLEVGTEVGQIPQQMVYLPKMPVVGPGIELFVGIQTTTNAEETCDIRVLLAIDV